MNYEKLKNEIEKSAKICFLMLKEKHPTEDFVGYALYSDANATSISPAVNTREHLDKMQSEDPDDKVYYKWSPGEWAYESAGAEFFNDTSKKLMEEAKKLTTEELTIFKKNVYEACVSSLEQLTKKGAINANESIVVFALSDAEDKDSEIQWISRLNDEKETTEFVDWIMD